MTVALDHVHADHDLPVPQAAVHAIAVGTIDEVVAPLADKARRRLRHGTAVALRLGWLDADLDTKRAIARAFGRAWRDAMVADGAPSELALEIDRPQISELAPGRATRTLLPHHDGGHCSYLTPSLRDLPEFDAGWRAFSSERFSTTPAHKLYQGIFVEDCGDGDSVTTYLPWIRMIADAHAHQHGGAGELADVVAWVAGNVGFARVARERWGARYLSISAELGHRAPVHVALAVHQAEAPFGAAAHERFPELAALCAACPCGQCAGEQERLWCHALVDVLGLSWRDARRRYEVRLATEPGDLLIGHNLAAVHGGLRAGAGRHLEPMCLVVDAPRGEQYEAWLAALWRDHSGRG